MLSEWVSEVVLVIPTWHWIYLDQFNFILYLICFWQYSFVRCLVYSCGVTVHLTSGWVFKAMIYIAVCISDVLFPHRTPLKGVAGADASPCSLLTHFLLQLPLPLPPLSFMYFSFLPLVPIVSDLWLYCKIDDGVHASCVLTINLYGVWRLFLDQFCLFMGYKGKT